MHLSFLGIEDPQIWLAYVMCILAAIASITYGALNWNKGNIEANSEDKKWAEEEEKLDREFE